MKRLREWLPFTGLIVLLHGAAALLPAILPPAWRGLHIETFLRLLATLGTVQLASSALTVVFRHRFGLVLGGIAAGIASSTLATLLQARRSRELSASADRNEAVVFLAAYLGMLTQASFIVYGGLAEPTLRLFAMFAVSALLVLVMIGVRQWRTAGDGYQATLGDPPHISDLVKLAAFMLALIALTHYLQRWLGSQALYGVTTIASFFEMHGALMSNIQLHELGRLDDHVLVTLILLSLMASNLSKAGIAGFQGSAYFRLKVALWLAILSAAQAATWWALA